MLEKDKQIIWQAQEMIYEVGAKSEFAYIVVQGFVYLYTNQGLLLGRVGEGEIFGETSCILKTTRSVRAVSGEHKVLATKIPHSELKNLLSKDKVLSAILRKTQIRLTDSNNQSQDLATDLDSVLNKIETKNVNIKGIEGHLRLIRKKLNAMHYID